MALGQQDGTVDWAKGQRADVLGMVMRNMGAVHRAGPSPAPSTQHQTQGRGRAWVRLKEHLLS